MSVVFLSLGSNEGDKLHHLSSAKELIAARLGKIEKISSIYETEAWGKTDQASFYNQVISVHTSLDPVNCLYNVLQIEQDLGRVRIEKWGSRIIDIDILFYENEIVLDSNLRIPHPYIEQRNFVLQPLVEIAPNFIHPVWNLSMEDLLKNSKDQLEVKKIAAL
ncbi:MAG: 2-amino-4-hydroxy-6-hydroxymethyldihydropteridine diphosphokinase [Cytophagaceae bacterium]